MTKRIFTTLWVLCLTCKLGFGQDMVLSGTVKDVQGSPMPGVAVLIKGTTLGVVTQNDGTYSLFMGQADKDAVLVFSFLGFKNTGIEMERQNSDRCYPGRRTARTGRRSSHSFRD